MYLDHFGLSQSPFKITPNTEFFYTGGNRGAILEALLYAIIHGEGIVKVTGEIGSGKTMLCRMLESMLPKNVEAIYLANPSLSREDVLHAISAELGLAVNGKRSSEILHLMQDDLIQKHATGKQVVLLVEEAQAMPLDTLEEIRLLSNLETAHNKLLQIVLFGQPELDENLALPRMRQLKERITHSFQVPPLAQTHIPEYLMFRMRAAGYRGPDVFTNGAIGLIADASCGITRRINILADKALLAAFSLNTHEIKPKHVRAAIQDSEFSVQSRAKALRKIGPPIAMLGLGIALGASWQALQGFTLPDFEMPDFANIQLSAPAPAPAPAPAVLPSPQPAIEPVVAPAVLPTEPIELAAPAADQPAPEPTPEEKPTPLPAVSAPQPETVVPVAAVSKPGPLQQRLEATRTWLAKEDESRYSIQLMITDIDAESRTRLEHFLQKNAAQLESLYVYPSLLGGKNGYGVLFGSFATRQEAQNALASLPGEFRVSGPILRTLKGVKAEVP